MSTVADSTQQLPGKGGKGKKQAERSLEGDEEAGTTVEQKGIQEYGPNVNIGCLCTSCCVV